MIEPIKPHEVVVLRREHTPDYIIEAFNEMIALHFDNGSAKFTQKDVVALAQKKRPDLNVKTEWLNVEPMFERAGWTVQYDKPGYNETYDATFTFGARLKR